MNMRLCLLPVVLCCCQIVLSAPPSSMPVEARFNEVRKSPPELYAFLLRMPKGGDLHNHLAGAVYAETFVHQAAAKRLCVDRSSYVILQKPAPCDAGQVDSSEAQHDGDLASTLIDDLSMRNFVPGAQSAHDHFFDTFAKFDVVSHGNDSEFLVEAVRRAAEQNESYLELMALGAGGAVSKLGAEVGLDSDFEVTRQKLLKSGLAQLVADLRGRIDGLEKGRAAGLGCDSQPDSPACKVTVKYVLQVLRLFPKEQIVRNGLQYSFLPGDGFWRDGSFRGPATACAGGRTTAACRLTWRRTRRRACRLISRTGSMPLSARSGNGRP